MCDDISPAQERTTSYFFFTASILSLIGSSITIVAFFRAHRRSKQLFFQLIFFLSLTDFFASVFVIVSQVMSTFFPESYTGDHCIVFRGVVQYFLTVSFFWTSVISIHLYRALHQQPEYKWLTMVYHACSWILPAIFVIIVAARHQIIPVEKGTWCHLTPVYEWTFWFSPMLVSVFLNLVFYVLIMKSVPAQRKIPGQIDLKKQLSLYLLAFVLCWIFDVIVHVITAFKPNCAIYWLWILQDFFSPLQGFLNFIVYGVESRMLNYCFQFRKQAKIIPRNAYYGINYNNANSSSESLLHSINTDEY